MEHQGPLDEAFMESSGSSSDASMASLDRLFLAEAPTPPADPFDPQSPQVPERRLELTAITTMVNNRLIRDMSNMSPAGESTTRSSGGCMSAR